MQADMLKAFDVLVQPMHNAVIVENLQDSIVRINSAAERLYGYFVQEIVGQNTGCLVAEESLAVWRELKKQVLAGRRVDASDMVHLHKNGKRVLVSVSMIPTTDEQGVVDGMLIVAQSDIAMASATEGFVRDDDLFKLAVEACPSGMIMTNEQGHIVLTNAECDDLFGYNKDELLGEPIEILVPDSVRESHVERRLDFQKRRAKRPMGVNTSLEARRKDGTTFPVEIGLTPIETRAGKAVLSTVIDRSDFVRQRQELQRKTLELKRSNEELENFAYVASHDLQEPLRMVAGFSQLLEKRYKGQLDDDADLYIHYLVDGAKRMQTLIQDLLTFSRVGRENKPFSATSLQDVMRGVERDLAPQIKEAQAEIVCDTLPTVPGNQTQLRQLFSNLVSNALKYKSERPLHLHITVNDDGQQWLFAVRDNGIGIEEKYFERIFKMFQRLHVRSEESGNGIGLSLVKKIVQRHGGNIWIESEFGKGSCFFFTLPKSDRERNGVEP